MNNIEKRRGFIINFLYIGVWAALIYCALKFVLPFLLPFVLAYLIAFMLKRPIGFLVKKTKPGPKFWGVVVLIIFYLFFGSLFVFLISRLLYSINNQLQNMPYYYETYIKPAIITTNNWFEGLLPTSENQAPQLLDTVTSSIIAALSSISTNISEWAINAATSMAQKIPGIVVGIALMIISSFFFTADFARINIFIAKQFTEKAKHKLFIVKDYVINVLLKYLRAYGILISITFCEVFIGLLILRVPGALGIAVITALVDILPVLGTGTIMIPWVIYSLLTQNFAFGIGLLVLYGVITLVRQILEPRVIGRQIGLYPLLTLMCMYIGFQIFGFWGMFALPIALTVIIHLNRSKEIHLFKE